MEQIEAMQLELDETQEEIDMLDKMLELELHFTSRLEKEIYFLERRLNKYKNNFWVRLFGIKY